MVVWVLWLLTSAYAVQLGYYPSTPVSGGDLGLVICVKNAINLKKALDERPRAMNARVVCMPSYSRLPGSEQPAPPPPEVGS